MEEINVENELRLCEVKRENLRKAMEKVKSQASEVLLLSLQWNDLEDYMKSAEGNVEKWSRQVESKEMELEKRSVALDERAKVVEAAEAEMGGLERRANGFLREIEENEKNLDFLMNRIDCCQGEFKTEEMRLMQLKTSVEECAVERRSKTGQLNAMVELLRKTQVELELKGEQLALLATDLERHRAEVSTEKEHLVCTQTRRRELEEEIERKTKLLTLLLEKTVEREKLLKTLSLELKKTHDELDLKGEQLAQMKTDLERHHGEKELLDSNQTRKRELEEEIERKREDLAAVLDKIADYGKQLESVEAQLDSQQKLLETRSSEEKELKGLVEAKRSASLDLDLTEQMLKSLNDDICQEMESKAKELEDIEKMIEERSAHYDSIKSLIEEHNEELASKENRQNEITEAIRKLSLEIVFKEKTLERADVFIRKLSEKQHAKENKLDSTKRDIRKTTAEFDSKKKKLRSVKDKFSECLENLEIKEKELKSLQSLITEKNKQVEQGEKKMQDLDNSNEELIIQLQVKQEVICSINNAIRECSSELESKRKERDQVQRSVTDLTAELTSKECHLNSVKTKLQDSLKIEEQQVRLKASLMEREQELGLKEKQFDARSENIELKEKELDARQENIDEKDEQLKSTEERLAKCVKDYELKAKQLSSFCQQNNPDKHVDLVRDANLKAKDEKTLQLLLRGHLNKCDQLHPDVLGALKVSSDPAKLVLDTIRGRMAITNLDPNSVRSSIWLLECLMDISANPKSEVQEEAIKFATKWKKATLVKAENPVEVLRFLHFLAVFSLAYTFDAEKVQNLFDIAFLRKYAPSLCEALGVSALAPVKDVISLDDKPEEAVSQSANGNALMDSEGSASLSRDEVSSGLRSFKDPRRFVLDYVEEALVGAHQRGELGLAEPIVKALVPFLEELTRDTKPIDPRLQLDAKRLANRWSSMIGSGAQMSPLEAWGFLQLIVAYGLVDRTNDEKNLQLACYVAHFNQAPKLFQSLGLSYAIPNFVSQLLNEGQNIPAVRYIFFFNLKTMFSPVELLKEEIINLRRSAKENRRFESEAEDRDAGKLREIIQVIEDFKLEIDLPVDLIVKFMVPRGIQNQNQCVPVQGVHMQASHTVIHSSYIATHGSNPNPQVVTYEAGGSTSFQAGFKRPRVDPPGPRSAVRPYFNPPSSGVSVPSSMDSLIEKATSGLELVDLSKHNFRRTLDSLQEGAHSLLLLTVQWKEIEAYFDSTKKVVVERAKELEALEESIKGRSLELETKEKDLFSIHESKLRDLEIQEKEFHLEIEKRRGEVERLDRSTKKIESIQNFSNDKLKELDAKVKELELKARELEQQKEGISAGEKLRREFEPLVSLLAKNMGSSVTMLTNCSTFHLKENATDFPDDLVEKNAALARLIPNLDPAKLVLDAMEGHLKEYLNKYSGEPFDSVVNSFILVLEKLMHMNPKITSNVKQQATQLGIDWIGKAKNNPNNSSRVLGCLLFLAVYDLASVTTRPVLLTLLERFLLYDQAPKLFRLLRLENEASGVVETLKKKGEYLATFRFICEFRLFKLCTGGPGALLLEYLNFSEKSALAISGTGNSMEAHKARREKIKADAAMALEYIREKKLESAFPAKTLRKLIVLKKDESAQAVMEPVHKGDGKSQTTTNTIEKSGANSVIPRKQKSKSKRQRLTEPITSFQNPKVNGLGGVSIPCEVKTGVNHQGVSKAAYPLSTVTKPNIISGFINADMMRELVEKQPLEENDLSSALKCTPDPAKLVLDISMALSPTNQEGGYEFKLLITSASCSLLLDQLKKLPPQIGHPVKGDAKKLAFYWKDKIIKSKTDELEVVCFLMFLGIYGIVSEFKANDLLGLLDNAYWRTASPDLCQFLGLDNAIPGFIQNLIKTGRRMKAIDYIYSFDMVHRFQPVSAIINDSLRMTKESAEKSFRDAMNESAPQVAAIDRQIKSLRAAIRCISCHKLESEFQFGNLKEQIKSLLKLRSNLSDGSGSASKPDLTIKQSQSAKPENLTEAGSVTSNTHLEPSTAVASSSVSKPCSTKKRGQKRSLSGNSQSSVHVASHPSNHFSGHGYSLNQRQTWPVGPYGTGTPNSVYNYNQWTQPEEPQYYQFYHPNPFYRNQF